MQKSRGSGVHSLEVLLDALGRTTDMRKDLRDIHANGRVPSLPLYLVQPGLVDVAVSCCRWWPLGHLPNTVSSKFRHE
jgi:hypothetical protein